MRRFLCLTVGLILTVAATAAAAPRMHGVRQPVVYAAIFTHCEDPYHPETPDFSRDRAAYEAFREGLLEFAALLAENDVPWNWQCDWNFLQAVLAYEVEGQDPTLLAATDGKNVVRYLHENLGVEIDPHSHEHDGYNYADVAYLITLCGVDPSPVVGGHAYDPSEDHFGDWPRFNVGISGSRYPSYFWKPELLMGAATAGHRNDPVASGVWRPLSPTAFFTTGGSGIASFGDWDGDPWHLSSVVELALAATNEAPAMWTATYGFNQSDFIKPGFLEENVRPAIAELVAQRGSGRVALVRFEDALRIWRERFGEREFVRQSDASPTLASTRLTFTLNTQDFAWPDLSAALVLRVLDLHERLRVPIDVSLTSTQAEIFATDYPEVLDRLRASPVAAVSYHVRAPKPYAASYDWLQLASMPKDEQRDVVESYETHTLDLVTGKPGVDPGGYALLTSLLGYPPYAIGSLPPAAVAEQVCGVFATMGARYVIQHGRPVGAGETRYGLTIKPEHVDLRLFEHVGEGGAGVVDDAIGEARAIAGDDVTAYVGVKMHDNDFFATQSAWTEVYVDGGKRPPWDPTRTAPLLTDTEQAAVWRLYEEAVTRASQLRNEVELVNLAMID